MSALSSFKPYLFTAYYNWIVDNGITPHLLIDVTVKGVQVPIQYAQNNSMVLSIAPAAISEYQINDRGIGFKARFRGESEQVAVPYRAMRQLIAFETGVAVPIGQALAIYDGDTDFEKEQPDEEQEEFSIFPEFKSVDEEDGATAPADGAESGATGEEHSKDARTPAFTFVTDD